jgi:Arylsulfotransferase (ASST)
MAVGLASALSTRNAFARVRSLASLARAISSESTPFATEPSWSPSAVTVDTPASDTAPGLIFAAPINLGASTIPPGTYGPTILDNAGEPVWFLPLDSETGQNFRAQTYRGKPVLTWYEGPSGSTYGGSCVIYDDAYREVKRVHGGNGYSLDLHEFLITAKDTALVAIYNTVTTDLTATGGAASAEVVEGIVQELEVETGKVLFEWHSLDHVGVDESYLPTPGATGNIDYFHLNAIDVDTDGNLLVSARNTSTVYKLDRKTGSVIWRLGGKESNFQMGPGATFNFQHDPRAHEDGTLTLFDNGAAGTGSEDVEPMSRPLRLRLDEQAMSAALVQVYETPTPRLATALGNVQQQPHGGVFVGWGEAGAFSEFAPDGTVLFDATLPTGTVSYRVFRFPWVGQPASSPTVVATTTATGQMDVAVSWNGATEVAHWQIHAGPSAAALAVVARVPRSGFETTVPLPAADFVAVTALDARGNALGASQAGSTTAALANASG